MKGQPDCSAAILPQRHLQTGWLRGDITLKTPLTRCCLNICRRCGTACASAWLRSKMVCAEVVVLHCIRQPHGYTEYVRGSSRLASHLQHTDNKTRIRSWQNSIV
jgi:hypothetical protein